MHLCTNLFSPLLRNLPGRPENGRWLRAMPHHRLRDLLDSQLSLQAGGRVNPPGSFPVLYAFADDRSSRPLFPIRMDESDTVIAVFSVTFTRILDLADADIRRILDVTLKDLVYADDARISQAIGIAAYHEGFEAIIYPRPLNPRGRNMGIFSDRVSSKHIQLLDLHTPPPSAMSGEAA